MNKIRRDVFVPDPQWAGMDQGLVYGAWSSG